MINVERIIEKINNNEYKEIKWVNYCFPYVLGYYRIINNNDGIIHIQKINKSVKKKFFSLKSPEKKSEFEIRLYNPETKKFITSFTIKEDNNYYEILKNNYCTFDKIIQEMQMKKK